MARKGASKLETEETGKGTTTTLERHHLKRKPRTKHETQTTIQNKTNPIDGAFLQPRRLPLQWLAPQWLAPRASYREALTLPEVTLSKSGLSAVAAEEAVRQKMP